MAITTLTHPLKTSPQQKKKITQDKITSNQLPFLISNPDVPRLLHDGTTVSPYVKFTEVPPTMSADRSFFSTWVLFAAGCHLQSFPKQQTEHWKNTKPIFCWQNKINLKTFQNILVQFSFLLSAGGTAPFTMYHFWQKNIGTRNRTICSSCKGQFNATEVGGETCQIIPANETLCFPVIWN